MINQDYIEKFDWINIRETIYESMIYFKIIIAVCVIFISKRLFWKNSKMKQEKLSLRVIKTNNYRNESKKLMLCASYAFKWFVVNG